MESPYVQGGGALLAGAAAGCLSAYVCPPRLAGPLVVVVIAMPILAPVVDRRLPSPLFLASLGGATGLAATAGIHELSRRTTPVSFSGELDLLFNLLKCALVEVVGALLVHRLLTTPVPEGVSRFRWFCNIWNDTMPAAIAP